MTAASTPRLELDPADKTYLDELSDFGEEDVAKIMGGNLMKLMKVAKPVSA